MLNTIRMEQYSIRRSKAFRAMLLISLGFSLVAALGFAIPAVGATGKSGLVNALWDSPTMIVLSAILAGLTIGSDFQNRMVGHQVATGHSRLEILLGKGLVFYLATIPLVLIYPVVRTVVYTLFFGWGEAFTAAEALFVLRAIGLSALLNIANSTVFVFFAFLFQDTGKSVACSILFYPIVSIALSLLGEKSPAIQWLYELTPYYRSRLVAQPVMPAAAVITSLLSGVVVIFGITALTYLVFRRRELK